MRKQYYFRRSARGLLAWDFDRLINLTSTFAERQIPLSHIRELEEPFFMTLAHLGRFVGQ